MEDNIRVEPPETNAATDTGETNEDDKEDHEAADVQTPLISKLSGNLPIYF